MVDDRLVGNSGIKGVDDSNPPFTDYHRTEELVNQVKNTKKMDPEEAQEMQEEQESEDKRLLKPEEMQPTNSIDIAHLLLSPSQLSSYTPELDKEISISNLKPQDKITIWELQRVWDDMQFLKAQQKRRKREFEIRYGAYDKYNYEDSIMEKVENECDNNEQPDILDSLQALRKSLRVAKISRGTDGFERQMQVKTIKESRDENIDNSERKPSFAERMMGGMKK